MRRIVVALALVGALSACGDDETFSNSLVFGTGLDQTGFKLVGEAKTFSLSATGGTLWFRLESKEDIDGRAVRLYFDDLTNKDFTPPQATGHITLANFSVSNEGTFNVKAFYVKTVIDIGEETLIASQTLELTP